MCVCINCLYCRRPSGQVGYVCCFCILEGSCQMILLLHLQFWFKVSLEKDKIELSLLDQCLASGRGRLASAEGHSPTRLGFCKLPFVSSEHKHLDIGQQLSQFIYFTSRGQDRLYFKKLQLNLEGSNPSSGKAEARGTVSSRPA